ncbi:nucleolar MIF4G domain-containing protein 1 [Copidosoma floridanum]|uniref:nucleolar MIF4G domain-containing protein 1 n=1 Tax=Copidosoma floridanum TaxID=29053 RepID=UPI0006C95481|nr:nucleolar MIF4G domain-containing protein 1 [Copidosoma floridanum]
MFKDKKKRYFHKKRKSQELRDKEGETKSRKLYLEEENSKEDRLIKNLEKKLRLNKKSSKSVPKSFMCDGLDYILEVCNEDTRKMAAESEKQLTLQSNDESDSSYFDDDDNEEKPTNSKRKKLDGKKVKHTKQKKTIQQSFEESNLRSEDDGDFDSSDGDLVSDVDIGNESDESELVRTKSTSKANKKNENKVTVLKNSKIQNNNLKKDSKCLKNKKSAVPVKKQKVCVLDDDDDFKDVSDHFSDERDSKDEEDNNDDGIWEDIYGRKRNKDGSVVAETKKYVAPAIRQRNDNSEMNEKLVQLKRQMKGLLNRLAESNIHSIVSQLDELYMSNSRNDMNEMITNLMLESIVAPVFTPERLITEQMMCVAILHANVGSEVGAHFIMTLIKKFTQMVEQFYEVENKELDNLVLMICHLYNFNVFGSQLIYQILNKLTEKFTEKEIEIILIILKTAGFRLRKDDPIALKELVLSLQQKATTTESTNTRVKFMLDVLLAIKNNNMSKIPQYDQSHVEHLRKILKTLIRKGNSISQLNLSINDLLNADENGKWWIVGSAWSGKAPENDKQGKNNDDKPVYSKKILELAKAQRMNTDSRRNIFCVIMTAEDYLDAFEKLHHLGLKGSQEREIIHVILNCCLQEKKFNPYYSVLLQKFCEHDRKYQMMIQYTLWDKFKMLNNYSSNQLSNMAKMISHLFIKKALSLSILKVIELGELNASTMKLFKKTMLNILLHEDTEICLQVFERIAPSDKLHQFREGLRLFINYFLVKNIKKDKMSARQMELLETRIKYVDKILMHTTSKIAF